MSKTFSHKIYASNGKYLITVEVTVAGIMKYAALQKDARDELSISQHCTGDTARKSTLNLLLSVPSYRRWHD